MSTPFQIDEEIDKLIDKFTDDLRVRIKKAIVRSEKLVLKQYMASQKETLRGKATQKVVPVEPNQKGPKPQGSPRKTKVVVDIQKGKSGRPEGSHRKGVHHREQDYVNDST